MTQPSSLKVLQVCRVAPPPPQTATSTAATSLSLTVFDVLWLRFPPVERLFFYEFPHPPSFFFHSVLPKLKHSLSLTLHTFLPLAGNLTWPQHSAIPIINYVPGDAVSLTVAESDADFNHLSGSDFSEAVESRLLIPHLTISDERASIMALQVTLFPDSGFSIGITTHHAAMDGKSSTSFMKSWAYICSNLEDSPSSSLPEHLIPFHDRSVIKDPSGIAQMFANFWMKFGGPNNRSLMFWEAPKVNQSKLIRGTFELTPSSILKLKKLAESKLKGKVHISTFSVTCAYVLECLIKAEQIEQNRVLFIFSVDCRSRMDPPVPSTYFGNCIWGAKFVTETKSLLGDDGFVSALERISEGLKKSEEEGMSGVERLISDMENVMKDRNQRKFSVAGSPRFEVYGNDFGWGRPKKVEIVSIDETGAFSLAESRNRDGGIEIGLVLNEPQMEAFAALFLKGV